MISNVLPNVLPNVSDNMIGTAEEPSAVFWTTKTSTVTFNLRGTAGKIISISWGDGNSTELPLQGLLTSVAFVHDYLGLVGTKKITMTGDLLYVTYLSASSNNLTGNLSSVSGLTSLVTLSLYTNQLTGNLSHVAGLTGLTYLALNSNQLTGDLSPLSGLTSLNYLTLNTNQLIGNISYVSGLTSLNFLYFNTNQLTGNLSSLAGLTALSALFAYGNALTYTYTAFPAWSGTTYDLSSTVLTATEVDNLLIAAANGGVNNCIYKVGGTNPSRTAASDAAIMTLLAAGVTVYVNE